MKRREGRERGGESICFLSGIQLEEEQMTKEEEEEEEVRAGLRTCITHDFLREKTNRTSSCGLVHVSRHVLAQCVFSELASVSHCGREAGRGFGPPAAQRAQQQLEPADCGFKCL